MGDAGNVLLAFRVAFNKAIGGGQLPEFLADTFIGKRRTDKIYFRLTQAQVNRQPGLVFAVSGHSYKLRRKLRAVLLERFFINRQLFLQRTPAAHRRNKPPTVDLLHNAGESLGRFTF